jgi:hypothetical protein
MANPKPKKREATPKAPKVSPASVDEPPASSPADPPEELAAVWDDEIAKAFQALRPQQQNFLMAYMRTGNAAESYRQAYNKLAKDHLASVAGSQVLASIGITSILSKFEDQKTADMFLIVQTYREMIQATKPEWVQNDEDKTWENVGDVPDWKARKDAADGLAKLRGLNAAEKVDHTVQAKVVHVIAPPKKPAGHGSAQPG